jgi:putative phosphoesterase
MKIGIISDIHGNEHALGKVLDHCTYMGVERLFILGDFVGYYYGAKIVYELLKGWQVSAVRGNHEEILSALMNKSLSDRAVIRKYGNGHLVALADLTEEALTYFIELPQSLEIQLNGKRIFLCHSNPWHSPEYIYPDTGLSILQKFGQYSYDYILFGHSHYPCTFSMNGVTCINPGSVGQARDKFSLASYSILNTENEVITFYKIPYDKSKLLAQVRQFDSKSNYHRTVLER